MEINRQGAIVLCGIVLIVGGFWYAAGTFLGRNGSTLGESAVAAQSSAGAEPRWEPVKDKEKKAIVSAEERDKLLSAAQLWRAPSTPIEQVSFAADPQAPDEIRCRFTVSELGGTTPKFDCTLEHGEPIRVKYGKTGEVPGEVASTRLLRALGFGADEVSYVQRLRCYGCPEEPFTVMKAVELTQAETFYKSLMLSYDSYEDFAWAATERKFPGRPIETGEMAGWAMFELDKIDPSNGGSPRAHVDALRLLSVFLAHWDNKADNQRLVCQAPFDPEKGETCARPFLLLQDVGSTFGPSKVDLEAWKKTPIWEDRASCLTSMKELPYDGATYGEARISEAGRRFLSDKLIKLSDRQLTDLFASSRFDDALGLLRRRSPIAEWVTAFKERVRQIADGPPCPSTT
jgi:hypothetical protein